jgi:hypothetical protein
MATRTRERADVDQAQPTHQVTIVRSGGPPPFSDRTVGCYEGKKSKLTCRSNIKRVGHRFAIARPAASGHRIAHSSQIVNGLVQRWISIADRRNKQCRQFEVELGACRSISTFLSIERPAYGLRARRVGIRTEHVCDFAVCHPNLWHWAISSRSGTWTNLVNPRFPAGPDPAIRWFLVERIAKRNDRAQSFIKVLPTKAKAQVATVGGRTWHTR